MTKEQNFFKKRIVVAIFGIVALLAGFYFLNFHSAVNLSGQVTGNSVISGFYPFSAISLVGLLLILCSAILIVYAIAKRD